MCMCSFFRLLALPGLIVDLTQTVLHWFIANCVASIYALLVRAVKPFGSAGLIGVLKLHFGRVCMGIVNVPPDEQVDTLLSPLILGVCRK
jgi:hypothetical protein